MDNFCRMNLPATTDLPEFVFELPGLQFPERINCAAALLDDAVAKRGWGDRVAIRTESGAAWTYRELLELSNRIANMLVRDGALVPGNRVLLHGTNHPFLAAAWFAVVKAGGVVVTTMPLLRAGELSKVIAQAKVSHALCEASVSAELHAATQAMPGVGFLRCYETDDAAAFERLMREYPAAFETVDTQADDPCIVAFTSGTTGRPKATVHFHRDVMAICHCFPQHVLKPRADDVFCGTPPFAFTFGLGALLLFPLSVGASAVLLQRAKPDRLFAAIAAHRVSILFTAPAAYRAMLDDIGGHDISSLRKCVCAGEALPVPTRNAWLARTSIRIIDGIGSTEMLHIFASADETQVKEGAVGRAVPGYRLAILDERGERLPPYHVGRLAVRGPTGCRYLNDARQRDYVQHGWNLTGDAAYLDEDGYLFYQSRADDLIISLGYTISPAEVEEAMLRHADVLECGVVGAPDERGGTLVCAHVVLRPGVCASDALTAALQQHVKAQIAPYKYPRRIEYRADGLPRNESGKLQRFKLRQAAESDVQAA
ncbi:MULTISPECIES: AMP-binding protein [Burkholderia]|uniref:AMP-binding protein n=1 Tax=Burkholderia TaxID=32008 RepID=UPI00075AC986|nr:MULTISPECIES: AMP-binding protein [Burkholderia]AOJ72096.1 2-aminobenzoate-CoA ligase [Burkholderia savannae]KVG50080.1 2-aminobenzoate-CoA ligase [Burkholderia sp. MSMB0265]KVG80814.1 2-aminobenzoate-CoA ligase [Burkholderia sp. MSMB2040]KVG96758.1 2-aminobenzoate-CoA ligase [Burkholderia sp. MSMB2042]KVG98858.1 2-aminobenzoate-CoA ligase [Burkholderia sp. MSMB2041]